MSDAEREGPWEGCEGQRRGNRTGRGVTVGAVHHADGEAGWCGEADAEAAGRDMVGGRRSSMDDVDAVTVRGKAVLSEGNAG